MNKSIFSTKSPKDLLCVCSTEKEGLKKALNAFDLITMGVGAIVGAGIFVVTGVAAAGDINSAGEILRTPAGPALSISFILTSLACCFCALCYAEFAAMLPVAGSAYTFAYASLGEIFAWIIGWDLILEYTFDGSAIAVGWSGYFHQLFETIFKVPFPAYLSTPTFVTLSKHFTQNKNIFSNFPHSHISASSNPHLTETINTFSGYPHIFNIPLSVNLPATIIILLVMILLIRGIKESAKVNAFIVAMKIVVILIFVSVGLFNINIQNWIPFMPYGFKGILTGASLIFFAYIGFDALTCASEEVKDPAKNLPIGIIGSLFICTVLYIIVTLVLTGIAPYSILNTADPIAVALNYINKHWLATYVVSVGAVIALCSTLIVFVMGQPRIFFSMSRDGFLPPIFSKLHPKYKTPVFSTVITAVALMILAGFFDIGKLAELGNIGTLFAFLMVCLGVLVLRKKHPDLPRPFKVPFMPYVPILGIILCITLISFLPMIAWIGFFLWLVIGLFIYFSYSRKNIK